ncbi:hypothetical protein KSS87_002641 [Heliosperma pusillum]|nr:hypothetical protein KSS87_002641 [Heliosperma pusillum]
MATSSVKPLLVGVEFYAGADDLLFRSPTFLFHHNVGASTTFPHAGASPLNTINREHHRRSIPRLALQPVFRRNLMPRSRLPIRSFSEVFYGSILPKRGKNNGLVAAESFQTAADWKGNFGYGGESTRKPIGEQVVNALQLGHRNQASSLLSEFDAAIHMINAEDIVSILEYCAKTPDPLFVMETWRVLQEKKITLTRHYCLLIVRALFNGGHIEELAVLEKNLLAVHEILREQCKYYNLNIISLRKFVRSFTTLNDFESAYKTLQYMVSVALKEGTYLRRTMLGKIICPNLDIPIPSATVTSILDSDLSQDRDFTTNISDDCDEMITNTNKDLQCIPLNLDASTLENPKKGPIKKVLRWSFNDVIRACGQWRNAELAGKLIVQMQNLGLEPSPWTYDCFVRAVIPGRRICDTVELLKIMEEKEVKLYDPTLLILSISCSKALNLDLAESLLNQITRCSYPHAYNVFLAACDKVEQPERAIPMLAKMRDLNIKPDIRTYALLFSLFGNVNAPYEKGNLMSQAVVTQRVDAIQADMLENGVQHNPASMFYLLNALGSEGMVQEMLQQLYWAEKHLSALNCLDVHVYNAVLQWLVEAKETYKAVEIFKNLKLCGLQPNAATYNIMIDCCSNGRCLKSACALVSLMIRDGFPPQTPTYTVLIKVVLKYNAFDEALNLLEQALSEKSKPDVLLFNTILYRASLKGNISVMEHVLKLMHREKIQPDPSTCCYVFDAYADHGFFGTAVEALQVLSIQMISKKNNISETTRNKYEELILSEEPDAEMKIMQKFTRSVNLAAGLLNLRWCALVGASISWDPDQSPWAKRLRDTDYR